MDDSDRKSRSFKFRKTNEHTTMYDMGHMDSLWQERNEVRHQKDNEYNAAEDEHISKRSMSSIDTGWWITMISL